MRYMFLMYNRELPDGGSPELSEKIRREHAATMKEATDKKILLAVEGLHPSSTATTVRMNGEKPVTLDGPFAETKEQLAGFYILECADLNEAIEWAKRMPTGCKGEPGGVEIRPVADLPRVPST
ncbi:MAG: YciI family protein [Acidobacteriaceae bacterium]|nr:YciI family protein [Acidobacteriaceae bacterium]